MERPSEEIINLASEFQNSMAGDGLLPRFAKLYSQYTRLRENQPGLTGWRGNREVSERLDDVVRLIEASFIKKEFGNDDSWRKGMRRAGELLEWLSLPELNPDKLPIRLLSAAAYQVAGYPARASGLLKENNIETIESAILKSLLQANFPTLLDELSKYWVTKEIRYPQPESNTDNKNNDNSDVTISSFQEQIIAETASALGILCATMRWGNEPRQDKALEKLFAVSKFLLHGKDSYSWLLAKLCAEVAEIYTESSMRHHLDKIFKTVNTKGKEILERYARQNYQEKKALAWYSQIQGIEKLASKESFALCTPTGSGKTTIAEIALLQSLFPERSSSSEEKTTAPLVIYLVPSRALATEVESKLSRVLQRLSTKENIIVTGLYGGSDWGPTDTWLTAEERTILICTYEKAEALLKFLGTLFLRRVSLIVIDEAHSVQFSGNRESLQKAENRELRLESLSTRLFSHLKKHECQIIALSAVASELENALASWISNQDGAIPTKTDYRSTRQLIGRLECSPGRRFEIRYDLLDKASLNFDDDGESNTPYVPNPFSQYPPAEKLEKDKSSTKRLRPYLFWAAMNLAAPDETEKQRAVLISITEKIAGYAGDFLSLLNKDWAEIEKPPFFQTPSEPEKLRLWEKCLSSCEDYFGVNSREYQLLQHGIVVHHGKMPGLMSRSLIEVVETRIVHLVMATSTLSEGINLPFETVLIPSLRRWDGDLSPSEFNNLVGRAGRPGFGTEGRSLVLLENKPKDIKARQVRRKYNQLIAKLEQQNQTKKKLEDAKSPLAELFAFLKEQWSEISVSNSNQEFINWLEQTATLSCDETNEKLLSAIETLDSLDNVILSTIVEIEQIEEKDLNPDVLEEKLQEIWQRSYAYYASQEKSILEEYFIKRGVALKTRIYSDSSERRRLYRTSLPPRSGNQLLNAYPAIKEYLIAGGEYAVWPSNRRLEYIQGAVGQLNNVPKFQLKESIGTKKKPYSRQEILHWWLDRETATNPPTVAKISDFHNYISQNFQYRFNWGLGSIIALAMDEAFGGELREPSLENWSETGLPWSVFWLKEIIVWGTLDPVAAYLLARGVGVNNRSDAEILAKQYYEREKIQALEVNERLNAQEIQTWVNDSFSNLDHHLVNPSPPNQMPAKLERDFNKVEKKDWRVIPIERENEIHWLDPAGFLLATSQKNENWQESFLNKYDFTLNTEAKIVSSKKYV